jgi:uncharacterized membrane protein YkoI
MTKLAPILLLAAACTGSGSSSGREQRLRDALGRAQISLADQVGVAEAAAPGTHGLRAELLVSGEAVYQTLAYANHAVEDIRVDIVSGAVISRAAAGGAPDPCAGSISLAEAVTIAEAAAGGAAVRVQPDDDDACLREVEVLAGDTLWEVKIGTDGAVLEQEVSDDDEE